MDASTPLSNLGMAADENVAPNSAGPMNLGLSPAMAALATGLPPHLMAMLGGSPPLLVPMAGLKRPAPTSAAAPAAKRARAPKAAKAPRMSPADALLGKNYDRVTDVEELRRDVKLLQAAHAESQATLASASAAVAAGMPFDEERTKREVDSLRKAIKKTFKSQMVFHKSLRGGNKRLTFSAPVQPATASMLLGGLSKGILTKKVVGETELYDGTIQKSLRYNGFLFVLGGQVNLKWSKNTGELTASGMFGMC